MFTREKAAEYLIVAWVKDWSLRMYIDCIYGNHSYIDGEKLHKDFPFLPPHIHWYVCNKGRGLKVRRMVAQCYPRLNDKLWDAKTDLERLAFAPIFERTTVENFEPKSIHGTQASKHNTYLKKKFRGASMEAVGEKNHAEACARRAWNKCKD